MKRNSDVKTRLEGCLRLVMSKEESNLRFEALPIAARYTWVFVLRGFESSGASERECREGIQNKCCSRIVSEMIASWSSGSGGECTITKGRRDEWMSCNRAAVQQCAARGVQKGGLLGSGASAAASGLAAWWSSSLLVVNRLVPDQTSYLETAGWSYRLTIPANSTSRTIHFESVPKSRLLPCLLPLRAMRRSTHSKLVLTHYICMS